MIPLVLAAILRVGQPAAAGIITGQVVDGVSGRPISAALVAISGTGMTVNPVPSQPPRILTAADGRFLFRNLGTGTYLVRATKGGYADGVSGRRRWGGDTESVELNASTSSADVVVRLWKSGAITGAVTDETGEPIVGVSVRLLSRTKAGTPGDTARTGNGFFAFTRSYVAVGCAARTDDRGVYRFSGLPAGDYVVVTSLPSISATRSAMTDAGRGRPMFPAPTGGCGFMLSSAGIDIVTPFRMGDSVIIVGGPTLLPPPAAGRVRVYPTTFYPAASSVSQASVISIATGEERTDVDIQLTPVPVVRVSGTMIGADGPAPLATLRLAPSGSEVLPEDAAALASVTDGAGNFVFAAVPSGKYMLTSSLIHAGSVRVPLSVGADDIDGVVVTPTAMPRITVALQFDGIAQAPKFDGRGPMSMPAILLDPADAVSAPDAMQLEIAPVDRAYVVTGYPPGRYRLRVPDSPSGWMFKAAMLNGVDVSETPFDFTRDIPDLTLVFTDRWTGLSGTVQGNGADGATVLAFPSEASKWSGDGFAPRRFKTTRVNARGEFAISSLPPGDYYVVAVPDEQADGWREPSMLDSLSRAATQITILEGESKTLALRIREDLQ